MRNQLSKNPFLFRLLMNLWPPILGAGIKVLRVSPDFFEIDVALKYKWWNRNYVGTQFGGALFAMTDPFYMLMLMHHLGKEHVIWDKTASIDYIKPGRGPILAKFRLSHDILNDIRVCTREGQKYLHTFTVDLTDDQGVVVAKVDRVIYVRRKKEL